MAFVSVSQPQKAGYTSFSLLSSPQASERVSVSVCFYFYSFRSRLLLSRYFTFCYIALRYVTFYAKNCRTFSLHSHTHTLIHISFIHTLMSVARPYSVQREGDGDSRRAKTLAVNSNWPICPLVRHKYHQTHTHMPKWIQICILYAA